MASAYDDNNIFAKILRGEIPSHKLAFLVDGSTRRPSWLS